MPKIKVTLYGKTTEFENKNTAKMFLVDCMQNCDSGGSEHQRYLTAYLQLIDGKTNVSDVEGESK